MDDSSCSPLPLCHLESLAAGSAMRKSHKRERQETFFFAHLPPGMLVSGAEEVTQKQRGRLVCDSHNAV